MRMAGAAAKCRQLAASRAKRWRLLLFLALFAVPAQAQQPDKGPVGWNLYRALDRLPELTRGVSTRMFSSFDRSGGNDDGFRGTYSCLRETDRGCVIAEHHGAGEIQSMWFTRSGGNVTETGMITVELDGQVVVQEQLQRLVDGRLGAPFAFPLVANADRSSGGVYVKVPMPYRRSMRVTVEHNPLFYHVMYRVFSDAEGVATFDPNEPASDVVELLSAYGLESPLPERARSGIDVVRDTFALEAGGAASIARLGGPGQIVELQLRLPQLVRSYGPLRDDGRAHKGYSEFIARLDADNEGVRLTRRFAGGIGNQKAAIEVDGDSVALWEPLPSTGRGRWSEQTVELPPSSTSGKVEVTIRNRFISSNLDFNEFTYFVESKVDGTYVPTDTIDVGPESIENERDHDYRIVGQNWQGTRNFFYTLEKIEERTPLVLPTDRLLEGLRLQIVFDGAATVDAPLGEFFGSGLGEYDVRSLFFAVDPEAHRFTSWWPMPFARDAEVRLVNTSDVDLATSSIELHVAKNASFSEALASGRLGYFHATSRRGEPAPERDWIFLDQDGYGKLVGVSHTMHGSRHTGNIRAYLEGDLRVYVDGSRTPQLYGTGTEDFYEGGWYFNRNAFHLPFNGNPAHEDFLGGVWGVRSGDAPADTDGTLGCQYSCDAAFRLLIGDAIPFDRAVRAGVEHGPHNEFPGTYGSTAIWYGHAGTPRLLRTDALDIGDPESRGRHGYEGGGHEAKTSISTFEGDFDHVVVIDEVQAVDEPVRFTMAVAPEDRRANGPVFLRRVADQRAAYQSARVLVDSMEVGIWMQPLSNTSHQWLEDGFWLPNGAVEGKDSVAIRLEPLEGAPSWHAASYTAFAYSGDLNVASEASDEAFERLHLAPGYPNPFGDRTTLRYRLPRAMNVELSVYDLLGRRVTILEEGHRRAGDHRVTWRPSSTLSAGVYFITLKTEAGQAVRTAVFSR